MDSERPVRLLLVGIFDLFHYGHTRVLQKAKELFPKTYVMVGVWTDRPETPCIMKQNERAEVVRSCRHVDLVLLDTPFELTQDYFEKYSIDYLVGDEDFMSRQKDSIVKSKFKVIPRTEGIDQAIVVHRVLRKYESHKRDQATSNAAKATGRSGWIGLPWNNRGIIASWQQWGADMLNQGYLRGFTQRVLHGWNILGRVRELRVFAAAKKRETEQPQEEESTDEEKVFFKLDCLNVSKKLVKGWQAVSLSDIELAPISGGLTNRLTKVSISKDYAKSLGLGVPSEVLVRHYGIGTETFFDRENEHKIFEEFSARGLGPYLYGFFEGGRVEEFMQARNIRNDELAEYLVTIGEKMANMHRCDMDIPKKPVLFDNLFHWLATARDITLPAEADPEKKKLLAAFDFDMIEQELYELKEVLHNLDAPVNFCHNDLLCGNMMVSEETKDLFFIDYEYGSYNYRGYDFGNHFCEWTLDYSIEEYPKFRIVPENYPNEEQQKKLFSAYLYQTKKITGQSDLLPTPQEITNLMNEANNFALAAHLLWSLWGIIQSATSEINFGYLDFSHARLGEYLRLKKLFIKKA